MKDPLKVLVARFHLFVMFLWRSLRKRLRRVRVLVFCALKNVTLLNGRSELNENLNYRDFW